MALTPTRIDYRITLSNVDRGVEANESVLVARHPSESMARATLRALAWCLLREEGLTFGPGLSDPEAADLWTRDLTGRVTTWVECGTCRWEKLRRAVQHHPGAAVHAVFNERRRRDELVAEAEASGKAAKIAGAISLWMVDPELVAALSARDDRRFRWAVTVVGDHLYVDADGKALDGEVVRTTL